jgi:hypothetical protein
LQRSFVSRDCLINSSGASHIVGRLSKGRARSLEDFNLNTLEQAEGAIRGL